MKIKLSELRNLIRESIRDILRENDIVSWDAQTFWDEVAPTADEKNSMTNALLGGSDGERWKKIKRYYDILDDISDIENKLAAVRRYFNSATKELTNAIETFPSNIIAKMFNFSKEAMFEINQNEREILNTAPKISFEEWNILAFKLK